MHRSGEVRRVGGGAHRRRAWWMVGALAPAALLLACAPGSAARDSGADTGPAGDGGADDGGSGAVDRDGDGFDIAVDCDDGDATQHPGADEICNGEDDDCDTGIDEDAVDAITVYLDEDLDGYGVDTETALGCAATEGWADNALDCDDGDPALNPETTWYLDADLDGYGDEASAVLGCEGPLDGILVGGDCDDTRDGVNPGEEEACNGRDKDCNGVVDDGCLVEVARSDRTATYTGGASGQEAGSGIAVGDVDGDGELDLVLGARGRASGGTARGGAFVIPGPHAGAAAASSAATAVIAGTQDNSYVGNAVAVIPDWDGDGRDEVMVGGHGAPYSVPDAGAVWIFHGPVEGDLSVAQADARINGGDDLMSLSKWVMDARADNDGDGTADLLIGAIDWGIITGRIYWFQGPVEGVHEAEEADAIFEGTISRQYFGYGAWSNTDFDGDGLPDLVSGTPGRSSASDPKGAGEAWAFRAPFSGTYSREDVDWLVQGEQYDDFVGTLHCGGDFDGDGYGDAVITAKWKPTAVGGDDAGAIYMYRGGRGFLETSPTWTMESERGYQYLGHDGNELDSGDVDGDGVDDLAIGWLNRGTVGAAEGAVLVQFGPLEGTVGSESADRIVLGPESGSLMGDAVKLEDMDGDGEADLWVSASQASGTGQAWLLGSPLLYQ